MKITSRISRDSHVELAIEVAQKAMETARRSIQGFFYCERHVIRDLRLPPDEQEIWSAEGDSYDDLHNGMMAEIGRVVLQEAIEAYTIAITSALGDNALLAAGIEPYAREHGKAVPYRDDKSERERLHDMGPSHPISEDTYEATVDKAYLERIKMELGSGTQGAADRSKTDYGIDPAEQQDFLRRADTGRDNEEEEAKLEEVSQPSSEPEL